MTAHTIDTSTAAIAPAMAGQRPVVGMVLHKVFPPDPRVAREAKALIAAGHTVYLLCYGREGQVPFEVIDGIHVVRAFVLPAQNSFSYLGGFVTIQPYTTRRNRLRLSFGPCRLSFKIPRVKLNYRFRLHNTGHQIVQLGPLRLVVPKAPWNLGQWFSLNRNLGEYMAQSPYLESFWLKEMLKFISQYGIQVLHVHDLPLAYAGVEAASAFGIPCVADMHENWPALVHINRHKYKGFWEKRRNAKARWVAHERFCLNRADAVVAVTEAARQRLISDGIDGNKITVVSNTIDIDAFLAKPVDQAQVERLADRFVVSYVGGFGPHRGIDTLLEAASLLKTRIPNLLVYMAGADSPNSDRYLNTCKQLAQKLGVDHLTHFTGWADDNAYGTYTALSHVGIIPHKANEHTETTMPNKIYNYMLFEKPVICSDVAPLKVVLSETGAGLWFEAGNPQALADAILRLYEDPGLREQMGQAGRTWVYRKYNWGHDAGQLTAMYSRLPVRARV